MASEKKKITDVKVPFKVQASCAIVQIIIAQILFASWWINIYLVAYWGIFWLRKYYSPKNTKYIAMFAVTLLLATWTPTVLAATNTGQTVCGVAFLNRIANFFAWAFILAGANNSADEVCATFGTIAALAALFAIGSLMGGVFGIRGGQTWQEALTPFGMVLFVVVAAGLISNIFLGDYFPTTSSNTNNQNNSQSGYNIQPFIQE